MSETIERVDEHVAEDVVQDVKSTLPSAEDLDAVAEDLAAKAATAAEEATVQFVTLEAHKALEAGVTALEARIAEFNARSPHKI